MVKWPRTRVLPTGSAAFGTFPDYVENGVYI